jgi:hypothetical protein
LASHALYAFAYDGEADAGAGVGFAVVQALKDAEDAFLILWSNTNAIVSQP